MKQEALDHLEECKDKVRLAFIVVGVGVFFGLILVVVLGWVGLGWGGVGWVGLGWVGLG